MDDRLPAIIIKDPLEDLIKSLEAFRKPMPRALIDQSQLRTAQMENDVVRCQRDLLQNAYSYRCSAFIARKLDSKTGVPLSPLKRPIAHLR